MVYDNKCGSITLNGGSIIVSDMVAAASFNATSDYRIKENIQPITKTIDDLRPHSYLNKLTNTEEMGFIAHELQEQIPFLVKGEERCK